MVTNQTATVQTQAVMAHHMESMMVRNFPEVLADYTNDSIVMTPEGTATGIEQIQAAMGAMAPLLTPENLAKFQLIRQDIQGEIAYVAWAMPGVVPFGCHTFVIRNGKIAVQTLSIFQG